MFLSDVEAERNLRIAEYFTIPITRTLHTLYGSCSISPVEMSTPVLRLGLGDICST